MNREVLTDIVSGMVAITIPLATYIAYLDWLEYKNLGRQMLPLARGMTRIGWAFTLGAILIRLRSHGPAIEFAAWPIVTMFVTGLALSCLGFLGVARHYHQERPRSRGQR